MCQNQLRAILIFLITPGRHCITICGLALHRDNTESPKNLHRESMNASHANNLFSN